MTTNVTGKLGRAIMTCLAAASLVALAACAGESAQGDNTEPAAEGEPATIRLIIGPVFYEPVRIAEQEGIFEDYNLDVQVMDGNTASENAAQLIAGQADIAMSGGVSVIQGAVEGLGIRAILGATSSDPEVPTSGMVTTPESGIESCADLEGKTVGLQGLNETTHLGTLLCAQEAGIDPSTITFVQLPLPNLNDAVMTGEIDAAYTIGAFYGAGLEAGLIEFATPSNDVLAYGPSVVYAASDDYVEQNGDAVERFQQAMVEAHELGIADNFAKIRDVQREYSQLDPDFIANSIIAGYQTDLYESGLQRTLDGMFEFGFISRAVEIDEVVSPVAPLVP
ncbi:sulfonate ABC transporter substrate-binding protein [Pseudoclavibacter endophyticus]|nr:ABC transporter substrate-binding protein [Pseudoclavibacter endophyticus]GGA74551.1 sulfonate ABC transporter substrate-binding protein [Pseudoclavibacter endophyticus]